MSDAAATLALCKWLTARIRVWEADAKTRLGLLPGERKAAAITNQVLGYVSMVKGRTTARVVNEDAFLAFVKARWPEEVIVTEQVNPAFQKRILDDAAKKGGFVDEDGVVVDGIISVSQGEPYPAFKQAEDADIVIAGLLARGALSVDGLKELEGP